jgi:hypothetical protein
LLWHFSNNGRIILYYFGATIFRAAIL